MPRRKFALREPDPDTGELRLSLRDPEIARKEIATQIGLTIRTAAALRRLVLSGPNKTTKMPSEGTVDPLVQLCLMARDEFEESEPGERSKFFKSYQAVDAKTQTQMRMLADGLEKDADRKQRDRHHRDKLDAEREKRKGELSDDDLQLIAGEVTE
jgi:hypothetical protein